MLAVALLSRFRHKALFQVNNNAKPNYCIAGSSDAVLHPGSVVQESACTTPTRAGRAMCRCDTQGHRRWKVTMTFARNLVDTPVTVSIPERAGVSLPPALSAANTFLFDPIDVTFTTPSRTTHNPRVVFTATFERDVADTIRSDVRVDTGDTQHTLYYDQCPSARRLLGSSDTLTHYIAGAHSRLRGDGHASDAAGAMVPADHARALAECANKWRITVLLAGNPPPNTIVKVGLTETRRTECTVGYAPGTAQNTFVEYVSVVSWTHAGRSCKCRP